MPDLPGLHVGALPVADSAPRDRVRQHVRAALIETLAGLLAVENKALELLVQPGQPLRLAAPWQHIGLSVSHEPGLSLFAIHLNGPVGIDLMRIDPTLPDLAALTRDYLDPIVAAALAALPAAERPAAFANAWCRLEAGLKCLATPLGEWTPALGARLATCTLRDLVMPPGWAAALAVPGGSA